MPLRECKRLRSGVSRIRERSRWCSEERISGEPSTEEWRLVMWCQGGNGNETPRTRGARWLHASSETWRRGCSDTPSPLKYKCALSLKDPKERTRGYRRRLGIRRFILGRRVVGHSWTTAMPRRRPPGRRDIASMRTGRIMPVPGRWLSISCGINPRSQGRYETSTAARSSINLCSNNNRLLSDY